MRCFKRVLRKKISKLSSEKGLVRKSDVIRVISEQNCDYDVNQVMKKVKEVEEMLTSLENKDCFRQECKSSDCVACIINKAIEMVKGDNICQ